jgi:catechol 2,3-dioxygenase-like lactoylglutathione lyase family enzyme
MDERPSLWVGHVVLASHDLGRSVDFYRPFGLRQLREVRPDDFLIELEMRGGTHLVFILDAEARTDGRTAPFDLMVDDLGQTHAALAARGVDVSPLVHVEHDHDHFTFRDPDGYVVTVNDSHVEGTV